MDLGWGDIFIFDHVYIILAVMVVVLPVPAFARIREAWVFLIIGVLGVDSVREDGKSNKYSISGSRTNTQKVLFLFLRNYRIFSI